METLEKKEVQRTAIQAARTKDEMVKAIGDYFTQLRGLEGREYTIGSIDIEPHENLIFPGGTVQVVRLSPSGIVTAPYYEELGGAYEEEEEETQPYSSCGFDTLCWVCKIIEMDGE